MWFRFAVVAVRLTGPKKAAHVFLKCGYNGGDFQVSDASLGAFCLPLGAESQTPKDRMAQEVRAPSLIHDPSRAAGPWPRLAAARGAAGLGFSSTRAARAHERRRMQGRMRPFP